MKALPRVLALCIVVTLGCATQHPFVWVDSLAPSAVSTVIAPGDRLFLLVQGQDAMSGELVVREDGSVLQSVLGRLEVAGLSTEEATQRVAARLKGVVVDPRVTIAIVGSSAKISVVGEVVHPGAFQIATNEGVLEAIAKAGGLTEFADRDSIFVIRRGTNAPRVRFRYSDLVGADVKSIAFRLRDADVVVAE